MKLIVFEGLDGSGKTTLITAFQKHLNHQKIPNNLYQGLGSSSIGLQIRNLFLNFEKVDYLTRFYLSIANMAQIQKELIFPQLKKNPFIILDRWLPSTYAYQLFPYLKKENQVFQQIFKIMYQNLILKPDLLIYLDIDPQIGRNRKKEQKNHQSDVIERKPLTYFQTVRQGYYRYLTHYQSGTQLILSGSDSIKSNVKKIMKYLGALSNGDHN
jgi:dTMP kinase